MTLYQEMKEVARLSAAFCPVPWTIDVDGNIVQGMEVVLKTQHSRPLAEYLTRLHNLFLPLSNAVKMLVKKRMDRG